jgi:hypothetical protein
LSSEDLEADTSGLSERNDATANQTETENCVLNERIATAELFKSKTPEVGEHIMAPTAP